MCDIGSDYDTGSEWQPKVGTARAEGLFRRPEIGARRNPLFVLRVVYSMGCLPHMLLALGELAFVALFELPYKWAERRWREPYAGLGCATLLVLASGVFVFWGFTS